jgi:crotonobetainyl-CoA:carnitine CoA-transferase CaiB-like acyl-CoA transferase
VQETGQAQRVHTSLAAAATTLQAMYLQAYDGKAWDEPSGPDALGWGPLQRLYRASDGWLTAALTPDEAARGRDAILRQAA